MSAQPIGIDAAFDRIQQIQSLQQQLLDGSAPASTTTAAASVSTPTAQTGTATDFASLLAAAQGESAGDAGGQALGTSTGAADVLSALASANPSLLSALAGTGSATPNSSTAPAAVGAMTQAADSLVGKPYVWGGGHSGWGTQPGYDCSGFVSAVLHAGGYLSTPQDTATLPSAAGIESGAGQYVTIYDRTDRGLGSDHVIIDIGGQFYESGGESGTWGGGGGVQKIATPSAAYLASFNRLLHPAGL
jgi:cell wall-associated NlpC family hydrolase